MATSRDISRLALPQTYPSSVTQAARGGHLDVDSEQVGTEDADVDGVQGAQRVPGDDPPLARKRVLVRADGGDAVYPAVTQPDPEPDPDVGIALDVVHPAGAGAVLGDDPERVALAAVADRDPADLAGALAEGFQDRQAERVDADREHQSEQWVERVALDDADYQHLRAATA